MKKSIIIAAMAVAVITLGIITACSKENRVANEEFAPAMKSPVDQMLQHHVRTIWHLTDLALRTNPDAVMAAAHEEDIQAFMQITGISEKLMSDMAELALVRVAEGGEVEPTYPACSDCEHSALSNFVDQCIYLRKILDEIHKYDPDFVDSTVIKLPNDVSYCENDCRWRYYYHYLNTNGFVLCMENCYQQFAMGNAHDLLELLNP